MLRPLGEQAFLVLHDVALPGWLDSIDHLVVGLTGVLTLVLAAAARAAPPQHFPVEHVDATLTIEGQCSFPVVRRIEGDVRLTRFVDGAGNTIRFLTTYANFRVTFTNSDTGSTFTTASPAVEQVTINPDGSFVVTSRGLVGHVIAGGGQVRGMRVAGGASYSRRVIDELVEVAKKGGARGLAWAALDPGGWR